jgi:glycosyltransferase involved in cell wall biosynthesis
VNGVPEIVEDGVTGRLVPRGDAATLARAALEILDAPEAGRGMGRAGRQRVVARFTAQRMVAEAQALYVRLLPGPPVAAGSRA